MTQGGSLDGYVRAAIANNPELKAAFEQWRADTLAVSRQRRLPNPTVSYGFFVQRVETRVGPQRHKIGVSQSFPWPTKLSAAADAAGHAARSARRRYEAFALALMRQVSDAYWGLWRIAKTRQVVRDQQRLLGQVASVVKSRVEIGQASLADLSQINVSVARLEDKLAGLGEQEQRLRARLRALTDGSSSLDTPIATDAPRMLLPAVARAQLVERALRHPRITAVLALAESQDHRAREASAAGYPGFTLGAEFIETGPALQPGVPDSGKDPFVVSLALSVPLWGGYDDDENEARARAASLRFQAAASKNQAEADVEQALSKVRDALRREKLYRATLVPQAEAAYGSVLGGYQTGSSAISSVLMSQRDLIELQLGLFDAQADYAVGWAELEEVVGSPVRGVRRVEP